MPKSPKRRGVPFDDDVGARMNDPEFREAFAARRRIHELAEAVRSMREQRGLSQAQLAAAIGSSQPTIARLERGRDLRTPRLDLLERIAHALGRQIEIVFPESTGEPRTRAIVPRAQRRRRAGESRASDR
jgi:transcriptional regulator with XRE-family HTH domain